MFFRVFHGSATVLPIYLGLGFTLTYSHGIHGYARLIHQEVRQVLTIPRP